MLFLSRFTDETMEALTNVFWLSSGGWTILALHVHLGAEGP